MSTITVEDHHQVPVTAGESKAARGAAARASRHHDSEGGDTMTDAELDAGIEEVLSSFDAQDGLTEREYELARGNEAW